MSLLQPKFAQVIVCQHLSKMYRVQINKSQKETSAINSGHTYTNAHTKSPGKNTKHCSLLCNAKVTHAGKFKTAGGSISSHSSDHWLAKHHP